MAARPNPELVLAGVNVSVEVMFVRLDGVGDPFDIRFAGTRVARSTTPDR